MYDYYLTVNEAFLITEFPVRNWFQWVLEGLIPSVPPLSKDNIKGISYASLSHTVLIPVSALPVYYREDYLKHRFAGDKFLIGTHYLSS